MATAAVTQRPVRASFTTIGVVAFVVLQALVGLLIARDPRQGVAAAVVIVGAFAALISPLGVAAVAFPASMATWRLGGAGVDLSYADAMLVASIALALPFVPWRSRLLRNLLGAFGIYLVLLSITALANPSTRAVIEIIHRIELVAGSLLVGAAVAAAGKTRLALRGVVAAAVVLAGSAIVYSLAHGFEPAYPFGIHKNAAGFFLTCASLILVVAGNEVKLPPAARVPIQAALIIGIVACQSRGSAATLLVVLLIAMMRHGGARAFVPLLGALALAAMIWTTSQDLSESSPDAEFNSLNTRLVAYDQSMDLWAEQPVFGAGIRFWRDPAISGAGEPHNLVISALGESGLVGTVAFVGFNAWVLWVLSKRPDALGRAALYLTLAHAIDSMAGIYWVAGTGTLPWLVVGLAAGAPHAATSALGRDSSSRGGERPSAEHTDAALDLR